jgi:hypothetical protein
MDRVSDFNLASDRNTFNSESWRGGDRGAGQISSEPQFRSGLQ